MIRSGVKPNRRVYESASQKIAKRHKRGFNTSGSDECQLRIRCVTKGGARVTETTLTSNTRTHALDRKVHSRAVKCTNKGRTDVTV